MPSPNQANTDGPEFETKAEAYVASDFDILPLLKGVRCRERAQEYAKAMNRSSQDFPPGYFEVLVDGVG